MDGATYLHGGWRTCLGVLYENTAIVSALWIREWKLVMAVMPHGFNQGGTAESIWSLSG